MNQRPINPASGEPLPPREQPGYYLGFNTLPQQDYWDAATRRKVLARVHEIPSIRFFTADETRLLDAMIAHILPQDDRTPERRIPILPRIDERLHRGHIPGYRFAKMPPDGHAIGLVSKPSRRSRSNPTPAHFSSSRGASRTSS